MQTESHTESNYSVQVEKASSILRKLTIKVPAAHVNRSLEREFVQIQRTAKIKGFRPGHVPISVVKQQFAADVRHQVFHDLINDTYKKALQKEQLKAVGAPQIDTPNHQTGDGAHDHTLNENEDLHFTATVEVLPEIEVKGYTGIALTKTKVEVTDKDVDGVINNILDSNAQMIPAAGGLIGADGSATSRPARKGDYVDMDFKGGVVTDSGVEERAGMSGSRMLEIGSDQLIPGFEDELVGMRSGETKTFRVPFPKDFFEADLAGKMSEFTVTINEIKEKKLPELDDDFAKNAGYESVADLKAKAREHLLAQKTDESDRKLKSDLLSALIEKNSFDVPQSLIQAQTRSLAQDVAQNLKQQGFNDQMIQEALTSELPSLKKRAESQVRASLILEAISKKEGMTVTSADLDAEMIKMAEQMKVELDKITDFYSKNPSKREDMEYRMREDRTVAFLLEKSKIK